MRVAAIDCGTNSIRLLVAEHHDEDTVELERSLRLTRLGQGVDATGEFHPDALVRTFAACDEYAAIVRSQFGDKAFPAMLDFAREVRKYVPNVVMTTVETTISHEDEAACQRICDDLGVRYRIRAWVNS